ncbi:MAG: hypothetical protein Q9213_007135 [Squamulea squamosa]
MSTDSAIITRKGKVLEIRFSTFVIEIPAPQTATLWGIKGLPRKVYWDSSKEGLTLHDENQRFIFSYKPTEVEDKKPHTDPKGMNESEDTEVTDTRGNRVKSAITAAGRYDSKPITTQEESGQELLLSKKTLVHGFSVVDSKGAPTDVDVITPPHQRPGIPEVPLRNSYKKAMPAGERYGDRVRLGTMTRDNGKIPRRQRKVRLRSNTGPGRTESLRHIPNRSQTQTTTPQSPSTPAALSDSIFAASSTLYASSFQTPPRIRHATSAASATPGRPTFHSPFNTPGKRPPLKVTYQGTARRPATAQETDASAVDRDAIAIVTGRLGRARTPSPSERKETKHGMEKVKQPSKEHKYKTGGARNLTMQSTPNNQHFEVKTEDGKRHKQAAEADKTKTSFFKRQPSPPGSSDRCRYGQNAVHCRIDASHTDKATQIPKKAYSTVSSTPRVVVEATASTVQRPLPAPNYLLAPLAKLSLGRQSSTEEAPQPVNSTTVTPSSTIGSPPSISRKQRPTQLSLTGQLVSKRCLQVSPLLPTDHTASPQPHTPTLPQVKRRRSNAASGNRPLGTMNSAVSNKDAADMGVVDEKQVIKEDEVRSETSNKGITHEDHAPEQSTG